MTMKPWRFLSARYDVRDADKKLAVIGGRKIEARLEPGNFERSRATPPNHTQVPENCSMKRNKRRSTAIDA
jgi:hypothetical protein